MLVVSFEVPVSPLIVGIHPSVRTAMDRAIFGREGRSPSSPTDVVTDRRRSWGPLHLCCFCCLPPGIPLRWGGR